MLRFLKDLMREKMPPPGIGIDDLPAWIDGEEGRVRGDLAGLIAEHRARILEARRQMEEMISGFDTASMEEVSHRKLAGVTERSLPLFLRAMRTSLARELPDDPEGFYAAAGEILKGCLSAFRGQGRYLASRFPEEMRVLRDGVDTMGREVNALTPRFARARERLQGLGELRKALKRYSDTKERMDLKREEIRSLGEEAGRSRQYLEGVNRALAELERGAEFLTCQEELVRIRSIDEERAGMTRLYCAIAATAVHLFRKGEKIAHRKKDREATRALHAAADLLETELPLPEDTVSRTLLPGLAAMAALAASGDLTPKNREEMDLLEGLEDLPGQITRISQRFREISGEIASARDALNARGPVVKSRDLNKEAGDLEKGIARAKDRLEHLEKEVADLEGMVYASFEDVQGKVKALAGRPVEARDPSCSEEEI